MRNAFCRMTADGKGAFSAVRVLGHAVNLGDSPVEQTVANATYNLAADGSGTALFPIAQDQSAFTQLAGNGRDIFLSADGNLFIGGSTAQGGHGVMIGVKAMTPPATSASLNGRFWGAGLRIEKGQVSSFAGSASADGKSETLWSRRLQSQPAPIDLTAVNGYSLSSDGTGLMQDALLAVGSGGEAFTQANVLLYNSGDYEIVFGIRMPAVSGTGVFLNPQGIVNAASFAPPGAPVSPGSFVTLFGNGLAPKPATAAALPFPTSMGGVQVTVNGTPAPLYFVSDTQISLLVPFGITGSTATFTLGASSVQAPLAKTSPGIFTLPSGGVGAGAILHADYSVVGASPPARGGEIVLIYMTGLGAVAPVIPDGAAGPVIPLSVLTSPVNVYVAGQKAEIVYQGLAPTLAGLYQLNIRIPVTAPVGSRIPLAVETVDAFDDQVDIAIAQ
jgi:uncharacterized protein (TIGR03437 family)